MVLVFPDLFLSFEPASSTTSAMINLPDETFMLLAKYPTTAGVFLYCEPLLLTVSLVMFVRSWKAIVGNVMPVVDSGLATSLA